MPRNLPTVDEPHGLHPRFFIFVDWGNNGVTQQYSSESNSNTTFQPRILRVSPVSSQANVKFSSSVSTIQVTLNDNSRHLENVLKTKVVEGSEAEVKVSLDGGSAETIFKGTVTNFRWYERRREVTFVVESAINQKSIGFNVEDDDLANNIVAGKTWPIVFGKPAHVPAVQVTKTPETRILTTIRLTDRKTRNALVRGLRAGEWDEDNAVLSELYNAGGITFKGVENPNAEAFDDLRYIYETDIENIIQADIEDGAFNFHTGRIRLESVDGFPTLGYNSQEFDSLDHSVRRGILDDPTNRIKLLVNGVLFSGFIVTSSDPDNLEENPHEFVVRETNISKWDNIKIGPRINDDSDSNNSLVLFLDPTDDLAKRINLVGNVIAIVLKEAEDAGYIDEEGRTELGDDAYTYVRVVRQEGTKLWVEETMSLGEARYFLFDNGVELYEDPARKKYGIDLNGNLLPNENYRIARVYGTHRHGMEHDIGSAFNQLRDVFKQRDRQALKGKKPNQRWAANLANKMSNLLRYRDMFWSSPPNSTITLWQDGIDKYVFSGIPSSKVNAVYGVYDGELAQVPKAYYTTTLNGAISVPKQNNSPTNPTPTQVAFLTLARPMHVLDPKWSDELFVTSTSQIGANTVDQIKYILDTYTDVQHDAGDISSTFDSVEGDLAGTPSHWALQKSQDPIRLVRDICFQAMCAIRFELNKATLVNVAKQPSGVEVILDPTNTHFDSIETAETPIRDIATKLVGTYNEDYFTSSKEVERKHNTDIYGVRERRHDYFIYNNVTPVSNSLLFWARRFGNQWRTIKTASFSEGANLEVFDYLKTNYYFDAFNWDRGMVTGLRYTPIEDKVDLEVWFPIKAGDSRETPEAWGYNFEKPTEGVAYKNSADAFKELDVSIVEDGKADLSAREAIRELRLSAEKDNFVLARLKNLRKDENGNVISSCIYDADIFGKGPFELPTEETSVYIENPHFELRPGSWVGIHYYAGNRATATPIPRKTFRSVITKSNASNYEVALRHVLQPWADRETGEVTDNSQLALGSLERYDEDLRDDPDEQFLTVYNLKEIFANQAAYADIFDGAVKEIPLHHPAAVLAPGTLVDVFYDERYGWVIDEVPETICEVTSSSGSDNKWSYVVKHVTLLAGAVTEAKDDTGALSSKTGVLNLMERNNPSGTASAIPSLGGQILDDITGSFVHSPIATGVVTKLYNVNGTLVIDKPTAITGSC